MTHSDMTMLVRGMAPVLKDFVAGAIGPLQERIAMLEQQVRETEQQAVSFRGVFRSAWSESMSQFRSRWRGIRLEGGSARFSGASTSTVKREFVSTRATRA